MRDPEKKRARDAIYRDHESGTVRGILCRKCNLGLGLLGDNVESLSRALAYLSKGEPR